MALLSPAHAGLRLLRQLPSVDLPLTWTVAVLVLVLLVACTALLIYALRQARTARVVEGPHAWASPSWELAWIAVPLAIVGAILVLSLRG